MPATTIGLSGLSFGTQQESSAVVRSYEETLKCDPVELMDGDGTFQAVAFSNPNSSANITIVSGSVSYGVGSSFTLIANSELDGMDTLYIDSLSRTLTNDGFAETQISASGWLNLGDNS